MRQNMSFCFQFVSVLCNLIQCLSSTVISTDIFCSHGDIALKQRKAANSIFVCLLAIGPWKYETIFLWKKKKKLSCSTKIVTFFWSTWYQSMIISSWYIQYFLSSMPSRPEQIFQSDKIKQTCKLKIITILRLVNFYFLLSFHSSLQEHFQNYIIFFSSLTWNNKTYPNSVSTYIKITTIY